MKVHGALVVLLLVQGVSSTARAELVVGPEVALPSFQGRDAYLPAAAFGGGKFLVAWQAGRIGPGDLRAGLRDRQQGDIVAVRLDATGAVLDNAPVTVTQASGMQGRPQIAFGGGVFLVVWQDLRNGKDWDVYAARLDGDGLVLDTDGVLIAGGPANQAHPQVAWDGADFVVVWQDLRSTDFYEVFGARVSPAGAVSSTGGALLASGRATGRHQFMPVVAAREVGRSLILWMAMTWSGAAASNPTAGSLFFQNGVVQPAVEYSDTSNGPGRNAVPACLAAGSDVYLAAWRTETSGGRGNAANGSNAMVLSPQGNIVTRLFLGGIDRRIQAPDATWDGATFLTAWHETTMVTSPGYGPYLVVKSSRVSPAGQVVGAVETIAGSLDNPAAEPAVAADGNTTALVTYEKHPSSSDSPVVIAFRLVTGQP